MHFGIFLKDTLPMKTIKLKLGAFLVACE